MSEPTKLYKLHESHIKEIISDGHTYVTLENGEIRKITADDLIFRKEELQAMAEALRKQRVANGN